MFRRGTACAGWFIKPTFSSRVKRRTRSFARSAKDNDVSRYESFSVVLFTLMERSFETSCTATFLSRYCGKYFQTFEGNINIALLFKRTKQISTTTQPEGLLDLGLPTLDNVNIQQAAFARID